VTELVGDQHSLDDPATAAGDEAAAHVPAARLSDDGPGSAARSLRGVWFDGFRAALPAWIIAHVVVIFVQDLAQRAVPLFPAQVHDRPELHHIFNQLYTWDTAWYLGLAQTGYSGMPSDGVRFWPLFPLVTRGVSAVGIPVATAVLAVCWVAALLLGVLMYRLALTAGLDTLTARRAAWLSQLAPGAFVLVMGYTEALAGMLAAIYLIAIRCTATRPGLWGGAVPSDAAPRGRWIWAWHAAAIIAGLGSGLVRPTGFLLAVAGAVELVRQWREPALNVLARVAVTVSPVLGTLLFLNWSRTVYGDLMLPYSIQRLVNLRGTVASNPFQAALDSLNQVGNGAGAFTLILVVVSLGLLWLCVRRLPLSYTAWAAVTLASVITAPHFSSFARYASGVLPLLLAGALLVRDWRRWGWVVCSSAALCGYFAYQSFIGIYVP
jgi:hypothetical protein